MNRLRFTLVSDGSSDKALIPILKWILIENGIGCSIDPQWADPFVFKDPHKSLADRIKLSLHCFPCDLLFVHRDSEAASVAKRCDEITRALAAVEEQGTVIPPAVSVVPVRMLEAWFLMDVESIRRAAGYTRGRMDLSLPPLKRMEEVADPKAKLHELLRLASGLSGRRLDKFNVREKIHRLSNLLSDFSPLRVLPAFAALEKDIKDTIKKNSWDRR